MKIKPEIFISFYNEKEFEVSKIQKLTLNHLYKTLKNKRFDVLTSNSLDFKESISDFIEKMGKGQYIIVLLTKEYLKSKDSMLQLMEILKNPDYKDRIYPIVFNNIDFSSSEGLLEYLIYWEERKRILTDLCKSIDSANIEPINKEINTFHQIRNKLSEFWNEIRNMKVIQIKDNLDALQPLYQLLDKQVKRDKLTVNFKPLSFVAISLLIIFSVLLSIYLIPSKVIFSTDIECIVEIENKSSLIIQTNDINFINLKIGTYKLFITVNDFPEVTDTIILKVRPFWNKNIVTFDLFDKTDKTVFLNAQELDNELLYNDYLIKFPYGSYVDLVKKLLEIKKIDIDSINPDEYQDYQKLKSDFSKEKINDFIKKYPESVYNETFKEYLNISEDLNSVDTEKEAFNKALKINTISAYQKYLTKFPDGKYVDKANSLIDSLNNLQTIDNEELIYNSAISSSTIESYENYLEKYPDGKYKTEILQKIEYLKDEKSYLQAMEINKIRAFETYLEQYPEGQYSSGAKEMILGLKQLKKYKMVLIDGGTFSAGTKKATITIHSFYIDKYEVTVEQYKEFCTATKRTMPEEPDWGWNDNDPIVNISWQDAYDFATWKGKRLPTEAEWEFAAQSNYEDAGDYAWYKKNSNSMPQFVGQKKANSKGVFDIIGNVSEWCNDWYSDVYPSDITDPQGPTSGTYKVIKGGAWNNYNLSTTQRNKDLPTDFKNYYGFRCASD